MALSSLISTTLGIGEQTDVVTVVPGTDERLTFRMAATKLSSGDSSVRMVVKDALTRVVASPVISGSGTKDVSIDQVEGNLTVFVECSQGRVSVAVSRVTGLEEALGEPGGSLEAADIADGAVTTAKIANGALSADATGRAKMANDFIQTAKIADAQMTTAKLAAGAVTGPKVDLSTLKVLSAVGNNGATTTLSVTGVLATDRLVAAFSAPTAGGALVAHPIGTDFAAAPTANDQIDQLSAADLSDDTVIFILLPAAA